MFRAAFGQVVDDVMTRKGGGPAAMARVLSACGVEPSQRRVDELIAEDQRLLIDHARVFEDAVGFLHRLRATGASSALVSNCGDHTRGLLGHFGFDAMVDEFVLSSEVGFLKPDARIFSCPGPSVARSRYSSRQGQLLPRGQGARNGRRPPRAAGRAGQG
jgi:beta-phosphoglucomutase-like phosphatase (HAD superfamily)